MLVSGSTSEVTRRQLDAFKTMSSILAVEIDTLEVITSEAKANNEIERCCTELVNALKSGKDVLLHVPPSRDHMTTTRAKGREMGLEHLQVSDRITYALAEVTKQVVSTCGLRKLILTGAILRRPFVPSSVASVSNC
jgi:uncharacterized protein YgbK (DUF1537 family)